jgi:MinD-like ATPase involved in chromosome partitioning or flagellar assembly
MADVVRRYLLIDLHYLGAVPYDAGVHSSLRSLQPFLAFHKESAVARSVREAAEELAFSVDLADRTPPEIRFPDRR